MPGVYVSVFQVTRSVSLRCPPPRSPPSMENKKKELPENDQSAAKKPKMMTLGVHLDGVRRRLSMPRTTLPPCERLGQGELKNTKKKKEEGGRGKGRERGGEGEWGRTG